MGPLRITNPEQADLLIREKGSKMKLWLALVAHASSFEAFEQLTNQLPADLPAVFNCDDRDRIIDGEKTNNPWPFIIQLRAFKSKTAANRDPDNHEQCGGVIVGDRWGMTAAHCVNKKNQYYEAFFGAHDYEGDARFSMAFDFSDFIVHPGWGDKSDGSDFNSDYALLKLPKSLSEMRLKNCGGDVCAAPVCLPSKAATAGAACWVGGWGLLDYDKNTQADTMMTVGVNIFSEEYTKAKTKKSLWNDVIFDNEFVAGLPDLNNDGFTDAGADACSGDSGGPLVCRDGNKLVLHGLVSWGSSCGGKGTPGVYANVFRAMSWVEQQMGTTPETTENPTTQKPTKETTTKKTTAKPTRSTTSKPKTTFMPTTGWESTTSWETTTEGVCSTSRLSVGKGDGYWKCKDTAKNVNCQWVCSNGDLGTKGRANCFKARDTWKTTNMKSASCIPCSTDPILKFPVEDGTWQCKRGQNTICKINCPNGQTPPGIVKCSLPKSAPDDADDWTTTWPDPDSFTCAVKPVCDTSELPDGEGDGTWICKDTKSGKSCSYQCNRGANSLVRTKASAFCATKRNVWKLKNEKHMTCVPCSADPGDVFPLGTGGEWHCTHAVHTKCSATCDNGKVVAGNVYCNINSTPLNKADNWKSNSDGLSCDISTTAEPESTVAPPAFCAKEDVQAAMAQKMPNSGYSYKESDFHFFGERPNCKLFANMRCPGDDGKVAPQIRFCCKVNTRGKEIWTFKGDPQQAVDDPDAVTCKNLVQQKQKLLSKYG